MLHYTIEGYTVDCAVEDIYYELAEKFISDNDNFYVPRLMKYMISVDAAKVCYEMPGTAEEISEKTGRPLDKVRECINEAIINGAAHRNTANDKVNFAASMVNLADYGIVDPAIIARRGNGFLDLMKSIRNSKEYLSGFGKSIAGGAYEPGEPIFRVLPKYKAIKDIPGVMPCENLYEILKEQEKLSVVRCMCRSVMRNDDLAYEGDTPEEGHCVKFGPVSRHYVEDMGIGRYMTAEEVMANLESIENQSNYHMIGNSREQRGGFCNCCSCCCDMRMGAATLPSVKEAIKASRFLAAKDETACEKCGKCETLCPFSAIRKDENGMPQIDWEICMGCGVCVINCENKALSLFIDKPASFIPVKGAQHIEDSLNLAK